MMETPPSSGNGMMTSPLPPPSVVWYGYLYKAGDTNNTWSKRFFILFSDHVLSYFISHENVLPDYLSQQHMSSNGNFMNTGMSSAMQTYSTMQSNQNNSSFHNRSFNLGDSSSTFNINNTSIINNLNNSTNNINNNNSLPGSSLSQASLGQSAMERSFENNNRAVDTSNIVLNSLPKPRGEMNLSTLLGICLLSKKASGDYPPSSSSSNSSSPKSQSYRSTPPNSPPRSPVLMNMKAISSSMNNNNNNNNYNSSSNNNNIFGMNPYSPSLSEASADQVIVDHYARTCGGQHCLHHSGQVKLLLITEKKTWRLGFVEPGQISSFLNAMGHQSLPIASVRAAGWMQTQGTITWNRRYALLLSTSDLLFFRDSSLDHLRRHVRVRDANFIESMRPLPQVNSQAERNLLLQLNQANGNISSICDLIGIRIVHPGFPEKKGYVVCVESDPVRDSPSTDGSGSGNNSRKSSSASQTLDSAIRSATVPSLQIADALSSLAIASSSSTTTSSTVTSMALSSSGHGIPRDILERYLKFRMWMEQMQTTAVESRTTKRMSSFSSFSSGRNTGSFNFNSNPNSTTSARTSGLSNNSELKWKTGNTNDTGNNQSANVTVNSNKIGFKFSLIRKRSDSQQTLIKVIENKCFPRSTLVLELAMAGFPTYLRGPLWSGYSGARALKDSAPKEYYVMLLGQAIMTQQKLYGKKPSWAMESIICISDAGKRVISALQVWSPMLKHSNKYLLSFIEFLLRFMGEEYTFWTVIATFGSELPGDSLLPSYHHIGGSPGIEVDMIMIEKLIDIVLPDLSHHISVSHLRQHLLSIIRGWMLSVFCFPDFNPLGESARCRLLDLFFILGRSVLVRTILAVLIIRQEDILDCSTPDHLQTCLCAPSPLLDALDGLDIPSTMGDDNVGLSNDPITNDPSMSKDDSGFDSGDLLIETILRDSKIAKGAPDDRIARIRGLQWGDIETSSRQQHILSTKWLSIAKDISNCANQSINLVCNKLMTMCYDIQNNTQSNSSFDSPKIEKLQEYLIAVHRDLIKAKEVADRLVSLLSHIIKDLRSIMSRAEANIKKTSVASQGQKVPDLTKAQEEAARLPYLNESVPIEPKGAIDEETTFPSASKKRSNVFVTVDGTSHSSTTSSKAYHLQTIFSFPFPDNKVFVEEFEDEPSSSTKKDKWNARYGQSPDDAQTTSNFLRSTSFAVSEHLPRLLTRLLISVGWSSLLSAKYCLNEANKNSFKHLSFLVYCSTGSKSQGISSAFISSGHSGLGSGMSSSSATTSSFSSGSGINSTSQNSRGFESNILPISSSASIISKGNQSLMQHHQQQQLQHHQQKRTNVAEIASEAMQSAERLKMMAPIATSKEIKVVDSGSDSNTDILDNEDDVDTAKPVEGTANMLETMELIPGYFDIDSISNAPSVTTSLSSESLSQDNSPVLGDSNNGNRQRDEQGDIDFFTKLANGITKRLQKFRGNEPTINTQANKISQPLVTQVQSQIQNRQQQTSPSQNTSQSNSTSSNTPMPSAPAIVKLVPTLPGAGRSNAQYKISYNEICQKCLRQVHQNRNSLSPVFETYSQLISLPLFLSQQPLEYHCVRDQMGADQQLQLFLKAETGFICIAAEVLATLTEVCESLRFGAGLRSSNPICSSMLPGIFSGKEDVGIAYNVEEAASGEQDHKWRGNVFYKLDVMSVSNEVEKLGEAVSEYELSAHFSPFKIDT